jgi:hypothetical protein
MEKQKLNAKIDFRLTDNEKKQFKEITKDRTGIVLREIVKTYIKEKRLA